ncbi:unnamed protein product [Scytosiphon promiscuus]
MAIIPGASLKRKDPSKNIHGRTGGSSTASSSSPKPSRRQPAKAISPPFQTPPSSASASLPPPSPSLAPANALREKEDENGHMKQGKYSKAESAIVVEAVKQYAATHSMSVKQLCQEKGLKGPLKGAWATIAECLPNRPPSSVYRHGIRKLHGLKMGPWTTDEVAQLQHLVKTRGKHWKLIEKEMDRSADACRDKHREIIPFQRQGAWTAEEEKLLNDYVIARMGGNGDSTESKLTGEERVEVPWAEAAQVVKTRNRIACQKKWDYLQMQRRQKRQQPESGTGTSTNSRITASANLGFVDHLLQTGAEDESELTWSSLSYPRAQLRWKTLCQGKLTPGSAEKLGFRKALKAVRRVLQVEPIKKIKRLEDTATTQTQVPTTAPVQSPDHSDRDSDGNSNRNSDSDGDANSDGDINSDVTAAGHRKVSADASTRRKIKRRKAGEYFGWAAAAASAAAAAAAAAAVDAAPSGVNQDQVERASGRKREQADERSPGEGGDGIQGHSCGPGEETKEEAKEEAKKVKKKKKKKENRTEDEQVEGANEAKEGRKKGKKKKRSTRNVDKSEGPAENTDVSTSSGSNNSSSVGSDRKKKEIKRKSEGRAEDKGASICSGSSNSSRIGSDRKRKEKKRKHGGKKRRREE